MAEWKEDRVTGSLKVVDIIAAAEKVNEDGMAVGLQPYEIRHLLDAVKAERKSIDHSLRHMPYLGGMHRTPSLAADLAETVKVMKGVALRNGEIEADRDEMRNDIRGMRRVLGIEPR